MIADKYEKEFLENCSYLDAITQSNGMVAHWGRAIVDNDSEPARKLCRFIGNVVEHHDQKMIRVASSTKDSLIKLLGYRQLSGVCSGTDDSEYEDCTLADLLNQLNMLVGLDNVKSKVKDLIAFQKVQLLRKKYGLRSPKGTMHLAFTGNPGTGKTTVARIVGRIYKKIGLLSKGHFIEVSRTDLIAGYQGQTAHKVKHVIEKAKGGVLFIDEAYSITENDSNDSYGKECLTELTKALEDYREDLVVIVAGYTKPMEQFFESNPGLKSRFNTFIEFNDYNSEELVLIFENMCDKEEYMMSNGMKDRLMEYFSSIPKETFANGRTARNIFEETIMNQARRLCTQTNLCKDDLMTLVPEDFPKLTLAENM